MDVRDSMSGASAGPALFVGNGSSPKITFTPIGTWLAWAGFGGRCAGLVVIGSWGIREGIFC
jgi:hypothetical protein